MNKTEFIELIKNNIHKFPTKERDNIIIKCEQVSDNQTIEIDNLKLLSTKLILIISIFFGFLGIDRFILNDKILGIGKLFTLGGFGFWAILDWFFISDRTRDINYTRFLNFLTDYQ